MSERIVLIVGVLSIVAYLLGGFRWAIREWRSWKHRRMLLAIVLTLIGLGWIQEAGAAICYVRDGGTATGTNGRFTGAGADWSDVTKVYDQLTTAETNCQRGDEIFIADGAYNVVLFDTTASGGTLIKICKAQVSTVGSCSTAHGTDTGWSDAFGDGLATFSDGMMEWRGNDWIMDGVTGGGPTVGWSTGFGFKFVSTADDAEVARLGRDGNVPPPSNITVANISLLHIEMEGKGSAATSGGGYSNDGIGIRRQSGPFTFSYIWMHGIGRAPLYFPSTGGTKTVVEYLYVESYFASGATHSEILSSGGSVITCSGDMQDLEIRYSLFEMVQGTAGIMWDNCGQVNSILWMHGNVFHHPSGGAGWTAENCGMIGSWSGGSGERAINMRLINNSLINISQNDSGNCAGHMNPFLSPLTNPANNVAYNNYFYNSDNPDYSPLFTNSGGAHDYNHHNASGSNAESHGSTSTGNPFVNLSTKDFHILAATTAGLDTTSICAMCNTDMFGVTRGADGVRDRGAVEFDAGGGGASTGPGYAIIASRGITILEIAVPAVMVLWHCRKVITVATLSVCSFSLLCASSIMSFSLQTGTRIKTHIVNPLALAYLERSKPNYDEKNG